MHGTEGDRALEQDGLGGDVCVGGDEGTRGLEARSGRLARAKSCRGLNEGSPWGNSSHQVHYLV